jgi:hypothetical protein
MMESKKNETLMKVSNYAEAIRSVGLRKLMNDLLDAGILEEGYKYDTFKSLYRRLKEKQTGLFLKPIILNSIWPFLNGFSYVDLFGGNEPKNKLAEIEVSLKTILDQQREMSNKISSMNGGRPKITTTREYVRKDSLFESAQRICESISMYLNGNNLHLYALLELFAHGTFIDRATWKHNNSDRLSRIDKLIRYLLKHGYYFSRDEKGNVIWCTNTESLDRERLDIGNLYLAIAYQIFLIERFLELYSKNIKIKTKITEEGRNANIETIIVQNISILYEENANQTDFSNCIKEFIETFDFLLGKDYTISLNDYKDEIKYKVYYKGLYEVIIGLNSILCFFVYPKETSDQKKTTGIYGFGHDVPDQYEMLFKKRNVEKDCVLSLKEDDLKIFRDIISIFKNLQNEESTARQNKKEEIDSNNNEWQQVKPKQATDEILAKVMSKGPFISGSPRIVDHTIDDLIS